MKPITLLLLVTLAGIAALSTAAPVPPNVIEQFYDSNFIWDITGLVFGTPVSSAFW